MAKSRYPQDFIWPANNTLAPRKIPIDVLENAELEQGDLLVVPTPLDPANNVAFTAAAQVNDIFGVVAETMPKGVTTANPTTIHVFRGFTVMMAYIQTLPEDMNNAGNPEALAQRLIDISIGFIPESNSVLGELYPDGVVWNGDPAVDAGFQQPQAKSLGS